MVAFWGLLIAGGVAIFRDFPSPRDAPPSTHRDHVGDAERILSEQFARGEIDEDEYQRRTAALHSAK